MSKIRGEYWIQGGQVEFADGDVGDQNHEMVALNSVAADHLDSLTDYAEELNIDHKEELGGMDDDPSQSARHLLQAIYYTLLEQAFGDAHASIFPFALPPPAPLRIGNDFEAVRAVLTSEAGFR